MLEQLAPAAESGPMPSRGFHCRVYQRLTCDLPGFCQPAVGRGSREARWAATVRNISQSGVCLQLPRRYEVGTGLAIELPGKRGQEPATLFVRVVRVQALADGAWTLGCQFVSPLSEDELARLLYHSDHRTSSDVQLLLATAHGELINCRIKRLYLEHPSPQLAGKKLVIRGGGSAQPEWSFKLQVVHCRQQGQQWLVRGVLEQPSAAADVVRMLGG